MKLDIYRGLVIVATVQIDESTTLSASVMGENKISATFTTDAPIDLAIRDHIFLNGEKYQNNVFTDLVIDDKYTYSVEFESTQYNLLNKVFTISKISGRIGVFVTAILASINQLDAGWTAGDVDDTGKELEIFFSQNDTCRSALQLVCEKFGLEFRVLGKQISVVNIYSQGTALTLEYGKNKGAYNISRKVKGDFFTRVFGYGSSRNVPANYRGGKERITFAPGYIDKGVTEYGVFEREVEFSDVYPNRTGYLTGVSAALPNGEITLTDTDIDFNLADNFIIGQTPKIVMNTGNWAGQEFEIITTSYNHTAKSFRIKPSYEGGLSIPNTVLPLLVGNAYVFIGINLPQSYVDVAEAKVQALTQQFANDNLSLELSFGVNFDPIWVKENNLIGLIKLGNKVRVLNVPTAIDVVLRIQSIQYPLAYPERISASISDKVEYSAVEEIKKVVVAQQREIVIAKDKLDKVDRNANSRREDLRKSIFDPSGDFFDPINIKPKTISTLQLEVGSRSQTFTLSVLFRPNQNSSLGYQFFEWYAGQLVHQTILDVGIGVWDINAGIVASLNASLGYYIYAKCNKGNTTGVIVLDVATRLVNSDSTYYYFLIGRLSPADTNGIRAISLTYGTTEINGAFIRTGVIVSENGKTKIDLNNNEIIGTMKFLSADGLSYKPLTMLNSEVENEVNARTTLAASLKSMAFEDLVQLAKLGNTIIDGGYIKTVLLDVDAIRALTVTAVYVEALEVNFVRGTIGGITIADNSLASSNGNFSVTSVGVLTAKDANISGNFISGDILGVYAKMDATGIRFDNGAGAVLEIKNDITNPWGGDMSGVISGQAYLTNNSIGYGLNQIHSEGFITSDDNNLLVSNSININPYGFNIKILGVLSVTIDKFFDFGGGKTISVKRGLVVGQTGF